MDELFAALPASNACRRIDFTHAEVHLGFMPDTYFLVVSGMKPYLNMKVRLEPLVYVRQPEYWGIEVVGCLPGIGLPGTAPYTVFIPLDGIIGTNGIEVIGAVSCKKINIGERNECNQEIHKATCGSCGGRIDERGHCGCS